MSFTNKYRISALLAAILISVIVIYLNYLSHEKTQEIYLEYTEKTIMEIKRFLKDTVTNMFTEIDEFRERKHNAYKKKNTEARLRWFQQKRI